MMEQIRFGGRVVNPFGLNDADPYVKSENDLQTQMQPVVTLGDEYLAGLKDPPSRLIVLKQTKEGAAIDAYVKAGSVGTTVVGPEIAAAGHADATGPFVQQAADANKRLVAIGDQWIIGHDDAVLAQSLAKSMVDLYGNAIDAGRRAAGYVTPTPTPPGPSVLPGPSGPSGPPNPAKPPPTPKSSAWVLIPITVAAVAGGVYLARKT